MTTEPKKTAVLTLDIEEGILGMAPGAQAALPNAAKAVAAARKAGLLLVHVGLGFERGYPEISPSHPRFSMLKERGVFIKGSDSSQFHSSIFAPGDQVVYKHRVSAFAGNALEMILRAKQIEVIVSFGFSTSGVVLSTVRRASDLDFKCACFDPDEEVHRVLTEKIFASQATIFTAHQFETEYSVR